MKHWSVNTTELKKNTDAYTIWNLEQMINFGLRVGKINKKELITYLNRIDLDPAKKKFLAFLLDDVNSHA